MFGMLEQWFVLLIYQPFLNLLVFFYWILEQLTDGSASMGVAVILMTIALRFLLLPQSMHGIRTEHKRVGLLQDVRDIEVNYAHDPVEMQKQKKAVMRSNPGMVVGEVLNIVIQVLIALMLWRMFKTGLGGEDLHLLYSFMPPVETPYNLTFMGIPLDQPNQLMNLILMVLVFVMEFLSLMAALPGSMSRRSAIMTSIILPLISFAFFAFMPAGKNLFVITTVIFSIILTTIRLITVRFELYRQKQEAKELQPSQDQVLVETK
jgi:membrane protein insertase Oxa1/YidC/SpoIIIJ